MKKLKSAVRLKTLFHMKVTKVKGISLVELILSICILSIVVSVVLLNTNFVDKRLEKKDIETLERSIVSTRNLSLMNKKENYLEFIDEKTYILSFNNERVTFDKITIDKKHSKHNLNKISFNKHGRPTDTGAGTIVLKSEDNYYEMTVTPVTGKVNVRSIDE